VTRGSRQEENGRGARDDRARAAFGPFAPLSAVTELQAEGIRVANDVAHRLTNLLDPASSSAGTGAAGRDGTGRTGVSDLRGAVGSLIDVYGDVLQRTFDAYADLLEERARMGPHLDGGPSGTVQVEITAGGACSGTGELWVSNGTDTTTGALSMVPTDLVNADGCVPAVGVVLDPEMVDSLAPGASTRVTVSIKIEPVTPPGYYHGYVLVPELPGEALPLTLLVAAPAEEGVSP
jgi:hypothetical protein